MSICSSDIIIPQTVLIVQSQESPGVRARRTTSTPVSTVSLHKADASASSHHLTQVRCERGAEHSVWLEEKA